MDEEKSEFWKKHMIDYEKSGMSISRFCETKELKPHTFNYWRNRLRKKGKKTSSDFITVKTAESFNVTLLISDWLKIECPTTTDPAWIGRLVNEFID